MLNLERLQTLFTYDATTGVFTFKPRALSEFATLKASRTFATKCEGKTAGWRHSAGYVSIKIDGAEYLAHRLAWLYAHGEWPEHEVDHINGDRADNRLANLRAVDKQTNSQNQSLRVTNTSGVMGVHQDRRRGGWKAEICFKGKNIYLGNFPSLDCAAAARHGAQRALGFSAGHGKPRTADYYKPRVRNPAKR